MFHDDGTSWKLTESFAPLHQVSSPDFGRSVAFDESLVVIGTYDFGLDTQPPLGVTILDAAALDAVHPWSDVGTGFGTPKPRLRFMGMLCEATSPELVLTSGAALASQPTWFVIGLSEVALPFRGGVLVASPDLAVGPVLLDAAGSVEIPFPFASGLPSGFTLVLQSWISSATATLGFAASNGVRATVPSFVVTRARPPSVPVPAMRVTSASTRICCTARPGGMASCTV